MDHTATSKSIAKRNNSKMTTEYFTPPHPLNTAVLFLVFNRLDTTKQVFEAIRQAKPPRLYIAADGARENRKGEEEKVNAVREYIMSNIDWDCEVKTLFREKNLGCKYAVSSAIRWFFENEEMGVILEDDCLPSQSFFWFCEELLERYKDNMNIGHISGDNFQNGVKRSEADYYFSIFNHVWGWASWANRWQRYDVDLTTFEDANFIDSIFPKKRATNSWKKTFQAMKNQEIDTWDYQWTFTMWKNNWLTILPNVNLISNIGFGADATHTISETEVSNLKNHELILRYHPTEIARNQEADNYTYKLFFTKKPFIIRVKNKIQRLLNVL